VAILSWTYLAAVCAIAIVMWTLGDRWWVATVFLYMGRWVFLLPLALLAPAAAALSWRSLVPLAAAALVAAVPIMGFRTGWRWPRAVPNGANVRIVTFNVDGGAALLGQLPRLLEEWGPDVVAFQECGPALAEETRRVPGWYHHDVNGLCLLSRFPIRDARVMDRAALEVVKQSGTGIGGAGLVARYTLQFPLGVIQFTNLHLETPRKGFEGLMALDVNQLRQNSALRDIESDLARKWVDQGVAGQATPFLVAGDFNTPVESRILRDHWSDLANAFSQAGSGLGVTKYNGWIRIRIDHVLLGPSWRAVRVNVGRHLGSDHRPLIADLTLVGTG